MSHDHEIRAQLYAKLLHKAQSALTILENMAREQKPGVFRSRWVISDEPLRNDAQRLVPSLRDAIERVLAS